MTSGTNHYSSFDQTMVVLCSVRFSFKVAYTFRRIISASMPTYSVGSPAYVACDQTRLIIALLTFGSL